MSQIEIKKIESNEELTQSKKWILQNHYIRRWPQAVREVLGIYSDGKLVGTILYGIGGRPQQAEDLFDAGTMANNQILELQRLYITDEARNSVPNLGSTSIARGNEYVRTEAKTKDGKPILGVVSYADSNVGHTGKVYKATNAIYLGQMTPRPFYVVTSPSGISVEKRTIGDKEKEKLEKQGFKVNRKLGTGKYKYFYALGKNQKERDSLLAHLKVPMYTYPTETAPATEIPNAARQKLNQPQQLQQPQQPVSKRETIKRLLKSTVTNPETGNKILVQTALKYDKNHPAYKTAMGMVNAYARRYNIKLKSR